MTAMVIGGICPTFLHKHNHEIYRASLSYGVPNPDIRLDIDRAILFQRNHHR
jgi:hypothetical protein